LYCYWALGTPVTADGVRASVTNNALHPVGTMWTVTDGSGNIKTTTQLVTVVDSTLQQYLLQLT
jgi:hypothetical protein